MQINQAVENMDQNAFTIVTDVNPGRLEELKQFLEPIGKNITANKHIDFYSYDRLHYCCFVAIESDTSTPVLMFEGNIDGPVDAFLIDIIRKDGKFLRSVYQHCVNDLQSIDDLSFTRYLLAHDKGYNAFYVAHPGRTLAEIKKDLSLRKEIQNSVDQTSSAFQGRTPVELRQVIRADIKAKPKYKWVEQKPKTSFSVLHGQKILTAIAAAFLIGLFILIAVALGLVGDENLQQLAIWELVTLVTMATLFVIWLRHQETKDIPSPTEWRSEHLFEVQSNEDRQSQNHLTSVTEVKPGLLRLLTLRSILFVVNLAAKYSATKGNLSGIVTIHFARWLIIDNQPNQGKRLIFLSNYDGSWENYLGEFIDHASLGLTAIWSNTQLKNNHGFPRTKWLSIEAGKIALLSGGANEEQQFKAYARNSQLKELVWFSAYPDLSVKNIGNNKKLRDQFYDNTVDLPAWLRRI